MNDQTKRTITQTDALYLLEVFEKVLATKQDLDNLRQEFSHLPTKDEFYSKMDEQATELKALREEVEVTNARSSENRDRIQRIENHLQLTTT